jgi:DNA-binding beta-propeller fold protein YncE
MWRPQVSLTLGGHVKLPPHTTGGGFDHGDVHAATGRLFIAHTANESVEVVDGEALKHESTVPGCPDASGVLCTQGAAALVFAAARGAGKVLVLDPLSCQVHREITVGPNPNGLAWDAGRGQLLVADTQEHSARLVDPQNGAGLPFVELPGRPRWCIWDAPRDRFLVNIREPACVVALAAGTLQQVARIDGLPAGPHGLDLDRPGNRAFVACDAGVVVALDLASDRELERVPIAGEPDAIWYSSAAERLYVAIGQPGVIDVVDGRALEVVEQLTTEEGANTTAFDSQRQRLYVFLPRRCEAVVYEEAGSPLVT